MTDSPPPRLDYGSPPQLLRSPRFQRWTIRGLIVLVLLSSIGWGPSLCHNLRAVYWERQCMSYASPADEVAYGIDLTTGGIVVQKSVPAWDTYYGFIKYAPAPSKGGFPVLFLHARQARGERPQLVAVDLRGGNITAGELIFNTWTPHAGSLTYPPEVRSGIYTVRLPELKTAEYLRFYTGQPDQNDLSHFTIVFEIDGQKGTIDGRVIGEGRVDLRVLGHETLTSER
jgi:hypothetical protein